MNCPKCGGESNKSGVMNRQDMKVQRFQCRECGHIFWEGQKPREESPNPSCPKCHGPSQKYGAGFKAGQKCRKYRCSACGHVFLGEPESEERNVE